ncbi:MAG: DUF362 domain-containing protein [Bacteroidales bacterium]|nr:DUF362 domain-containing protein [Bacteroidales bacterium]
MDYLSKLNLLKKKLLWIPYKLIFIISGIITTIWFLVRVIPKPSRATYPCMRVTTPIMSSFILYIISITTSVFAFKRIKRNVLKYKYRIAAMFLFLVCFTITFSILQNNNFSLARSLNILDSEFPIPSNEPVGDAKGLYPGRVVWIHDENATNEDFNPVASSGNFWFDDKNVNLSVIQNMMATAITTFADNSDLKTAWSAIFKSFNNAHGNGETDYSSGEKIAIKINLTNQGWNNEARMDATPQAVLALLQELIDIVGVSQTDITIGDPYREFRSEYYDLCSNFYPDVNYVGGFANEGIQQTIPSADEVLVFSDPNKDNKSTLPQYYLDAKYFINMACLKTHDVAGITLVAKNHQGSYLPGDGDPGNQSAMAMHYCLMKESRGSGKYRSLVDYMGHKETGGKTLIYIIDGIWGGENWEGNIKKFKSDPFNNDYPNTIIVSQDPVAIESVGFDILFCEYDTDNSSSKYPLDYKEEIADYLQQCASSDYWPDDITYDPENDGTPLESLGVLEHWDNSTSRQYSRNMGSGNGIELIYLNLSINSVYENINNKQINIAFPNPFSTYTRIKIPADINSGYSLKIFSVNGQLVKQFTNMNSKEIIWNGDGLAGNLLSTGIYIFFIEDLSGQNNYTGKLYIEKR